MPAITVPARPRGNAAVPSRRISIAAENQVQAAMNLQNDPDRLTFEQDGVCYDAMELVKLSMPVLLNKSRAWGIPLAEPEQGAPPEVLHVVKAILSHRAAFNGLRNEDEDSDHSDGFAIDLQLGGAQDNVYAPYAAALVYANEAWLRSTFLRHELNDICFERGLAKQSKPNNKAESMRRLLLTARAGISDEPEPRRRVMEAEGWRLTIPHGGTRLKHAELSERLRLLETPLTKVEALLLLHRARFGGGVA